LVNLRVATAITLAISDGLSPTEFRAVSRKHDARRCANVRTRV
jgi:hypothetical protein